MERHVCLNTTTTFKQEENRSKPKKTNPTKTPQSNKTNRKNVSNNPKHFHFHTHNIGPFLDHRWTIHLHSPSRKSVSTSTKVKIPDMNELEAFHLDKMDSSSPMPFLLLRRRCCCCRSLDSSDNGPFTPPCPLFFFPTTAVPSTNVLPPNEKRKDKGCKRKR